MPSTTLAPGTGTVPVPGGDLACEVLAGETEPVLAVHGVSSHRRLWGWLAEAAPEVTLLAPDLRGRADSVAVSGPSSLARHADDLALLLDHLGLASVPVRFLHAQWSVGRDSAPAYPPEAVARFAAGARAVVAVDGVDHAGSIMTPRGAAATAALVRDALLEVGP